MARTRYRWDEQAQRLVEVGSDWNPTPRLEISVDRHYENLGMQDGAVVNSRRQHQEYLRSRNLALATDFKESWKQAAAERQKIRTGVNDKRERREAVARAFYQTRKP